MDASDALLLPMSWCQTPGHRRQKKKEKKKKILIQLSLFYIDAAQNKTKQNKIKE